MSDTTSTCSSSTSSEPGKFDRKRKFPLTSTKSILQQSKLEYAASLRKLLFDIEKLVYIEGLSSAQRHLNERIQSQQAYVCFHNLDLPNLISFLLLADIESRLGSIWPSYVSTIVVRKVLEIIYLNQYDVIGLEWIFWAQKLELKILERGRQFELAQEVAAIFYENYETQMELEEGAFLLDQPDSFSSETLFDFKMTSWAWTQLLIMGDLLSQQRKFQEALAIYQKAREKLIRKSPSEPQSPDDPDSDPTFFDEADRAESIFKVENRIIKLFIKMRCYAEALELALPLLGRQKKGCGEGHFSVIKTTYHISLIYKYQGNYRRALEYAENVHQKMFPPSTATSPDGAAIDLLSPDRILTQQLNPKLFAYVDIHLAELRLFLKKPNLGLARGFYVQIFQFVHQSLGETHPIVLDTNLNIAKWFSSKKNVDKDMAFAMGLLEKVHGVQKEIWGEEDEESRRTEQYIEQGRIGSWGVKGKRASVSLASGETLSLGKVAPLSAAKKMGSLWEKLKNKRNKVPEASSSASGSATILEKVETSEKNLSDREKTPKGECDSKVETRTES